MKIYTILSENQSPDVYVIMVPLQTVSVMISVAQGSMLDGSRFDFEMSGRRMVVIRSTAGRDDGADGVDGIDIMIDG